MTSPHSLVEGVELMLFGLGLVFLFLVLLIASIRLMTAVLKRFDVHEAINAPVTATSKTAASAPIDADTLSAIRLAIQQHRARHG